MLRDVIEVKPLEAFALDLQFDDGVEGIVDLSQVIKFEGVFLPLRDLAYFRQVFVHPELGTVCWPNEADLDSDLLYRIVQRESVCVLAAA